MSCTLIILPRNFKHSFSILWLLFNEIQILKFILAMDRIVWISKLWYFQNKFSNFMVYMVVYAIHVLLGPTRSRLFLTSCEMSLASEASCLHISTLNVRPKVNNIHEVFSSYSVYFKFSTFLSLQTLTCVFFSLNMFSSVNISTWTWVVLVTLRNDGCPKWMMSPYLAVLSLLCIQ